MHCKENPWALAIVGKSGTLRRGSRAPIWSSGTSPGRSSPPWANQRAYREQESPRSLPRQESPDRTRATKFTLFRKVNGPFALPPAFDLVDSRKTDGDD